MKKCQADKNVNKNKELETLKVNDNVRIRFQGNWNRKRRVIKKLEEPRLYLIETEEGNYLRRNRRHLLKTYEKPSSITTHVDYENEMKKMVKCNTQHNNIHKTEH